MKMLIGGKAVDASNGESIDVINPSTGTFIDTVPAASMEDVAQAVACAKAAQKEWAKIPIYKRVEIMYKFLELVERDKEDLARMLSNETGKCIREARAEIRNVSTAFRAFSERIKHFYGQTIPEGLEAGQDRSILIIRREPLGVVAAVIPFNFPCDIFDHKVAPALLTGNACIVKPSTENPLTLCMLSHLMNEAGVTPGAIEIVTGRGSTVGTALTTNPDVNLVTLTGSTAVGIDTAINCAKNLTHCTLELGGNDAFIVMEDGNVDLATDELISGRMRNTGQVCCASKRFLVHKSLAEEFTKKAIEKIRKINRADPATDEAEMGCLINETAAIKVEQQVALTVKQGGRILLGGKRNGAFYDPTVIGDVPKTADVAKNMEIFGPVVPIIVFETEEEAIAIANASEYGLCGCVFTENMRTAARIANALECGCVVINGSDNYRSFEMPFGGYKHSGIGTEGVFSTFDEMTHTKCVALKKIF